MSKTKPESETLTAAEVEGAGARATEVITDAEKHAADVIADAEKRAVALIAAAENTAEETYKLGERRVAKLLKAADNGDIMVTEEGRKQLVGSTATDSDLTMADDLIKDAKAEAKNTIADAKTKAAKIIADAEDNAEVIKAEKARLAEVETKAKESEAAVKKREADKAKRSKAKQKALTKPQVIHEDDMRAALGVAAILGDMPTDLSALQAKLVQDHKAEFCDLLPQHTVKIYGMIAAGPAGFRQALQNWAAAVRRLAAQQDAA